MPLDSTFVRAQLVSAAATLTAVGPSKQGLDLVQIPSSVTTTFTITLFAASGQFAGNAYSRQQAGANSSGRLRFQNLSAVPITIAAAGSDTIVGPTLVPPSGFLELSCDGVSQWFSVASPPSSDSQVAVVTIPTASVLALNTTPYTLLPAPAAGSRNVVESIEAKLAYVSATYTGANALEIRYTNGSGVKATGDIPSTFIDTSSGTGYYHVVGAAGVPVAAAAIVAYVPTANPAVGDSAIVLTIRYHVTAT